MSLTLKNKKIWFVCCFLSKFNKEGYFSLGFHNWSNAYIEIAQKFNSNPRTISCIRDGFDAAISESGRVGWNKRKEQVLIKKQFYSKVNHLSFYEYLGMVSRLLNTGRMPNEELAQDKTQKPSSSSNVNKMDFFKFLDNNFHNMSFKLVFMICCLKLVNENGKINADKLVNEFSLFYKDRLNRNLPIDRPKCSVNKETLKDHEKILKIILRNPFEKFKECGFMSYSKKNREFSFNANLWSEITFKDVFLYINKLESHLREYYLNLNKSPAIS